jgi:S-DNA-T family DNA segregation ATPase FtsK/SpoIIIE
MRKRLKKKRQGRAFGTSHRRGGTEGVLGALELKEETRTQISGYLHLMLAAILFLVLQGKAGMVGEGIGDILRFFFGSAGVVLPITLAVSGVLLLLRRSSHLTFRMAFGLALCLIAVLGTIHVQAPFQEIGERREELGGAIGFMVAFPLLAFTSVPVAYVVLSVFFLIGLLVTFDVTPLDFLRWIRSATSQGKISPASLPKQRAEDLLEEGMHEELQGGEGTSRPSDGKAAAQVVRGASGRRGKDGLKEINIIRPVFVTEEIRKGRKAEKRGAAKTTEAEYAMDLAATHRIEHWEFPSFDLLDPTRSTIMIDDETLKAQALRIQEKLREFAIDVTMRDAHPGPTVTQFTLEPAEGVKLSRIAALKDDLALALAAPSLRIEAPIPGKSLVGIEMPNDKRTIVHLREILESPEFQESDSPLTLPLGRDVSGRAIVEDLGEMPHLLIAGATGSGKSVCMNTFLLSLLYQNAPHELKFILIDPKRVELMLYDGIPYLLTPVITEAEKALKALRWAVSEMGRRLARFSEVGARNLREYNEKQEEAAKLPRIVIVIDEFADLMMRQYRRETEVMITRVAQIARASGMNLIVSTQRPSVDVITGIIKANIGTRIAFRTVSSIDSRTILDCVGAEDLLGQGDMLFMTASTPMPIRIQGIYVSSKEVERVINRVKFAGGGALTEEIPLGQPTVGEEDEQEEGEEGEREIEPSMLVGGAGVSLRGAINLDADDDGGDELTFEAIDLVRRTGKASASLLQRHLKIGYARAARLLDILEEKGVVGPVDGAKPRKVYVE